MEVIKRKILLENSIDRAHNSQTYGTLTADTFYLKILITQTIDDMGMFTDMDFIPALTSKTASDFFITENYRVTGLTESKIEDVRTYKNSEPFKLGFDVNTQIYTGHTGQIINGVDRVVSSADTIAYVFGTDKNDSLIGTSGQTTGLLYEDTGNQTKVSFKGQGFNQTNTSFSALTKQEYLFGIISPPEVESDVFIERGTTNVIEKHLKLSEIRSLDELTRYGNGFYKINRQ